MVDFEESSYHPGTVTVVEKSFNVFYLRIDDTDFLYAKRTLKG